ncbi:MAG: histidinol-phosphate aminotransferase family protein, partial [Acidobacteria bacterium]|nr:histidinol-phosphate aminotransferase family protein [Acidobacteriota bacterium]
MDQMFNGGHGGNVMGISRSRGWDWRGVLDLSASINPLGPSPLVRAAIIEAIECAAHYPEPGAPRLAAALAGRWQIDPAQILTGNGSTELIHFLARAWPQPEVTLAAPAFLEFHRVYPGARLAPFGRLPDTGLAVLSQPNNPTGSAVAFERLREWLLDTSQPVLLDESFIDFSGLPSAVTLTSRCPNLLVLRSLTKFYALPGLRVGALAGHPDLIARLREQRDPWAVNVLGEAAALAALSDREHAERTLQVIAKERIWLWKQLWKIPGLRACPSSANFFLFQMDSPAARLCDWLLERKVVVR